MAGAALRSVYGTKGGRLHNLRENSPLQSASEHNIVNRLLWSSFKRAGTKRTHFPQHLSSNFQSELQRTGTLATAPEGRTLARQSPICASLGDIFHNEALLTTAAACALGQGLKPFAALAEGKPLNWRLVYKSGGMPSSHTSTVTALATAVGLKRGLDDDLFAICVVLAAIVMYDAQGVRYAVGKQAEVLNSIVIPEISKPPENLLDLAERREAPQAEEMIARHASSSQAGRPFRTEWDARWQPPIGQARSVTDRLEKSLSATKGAAWINETGGESSFDSSATQVMEKVESENGRVREPKADFPKAWRHVPLKETVGHSKVEVAVGGLAGVVLAFLFHSTVFGIH